jgi:3-hydroxyisobutyrate dehydrogenase
MSTERSTQEQVRVGILGIGLMGSAMAGRLLDQGIRVIAWDRNPEHAGALGDRGAIAAKEPAEVVSGAGVGAAEADRLARVADEHAVTLVDAPVSGSTHPAEEGQLTILASGPDSARTVLEPVFAALASRVMWVGEAGMGSRLKLATNHWMISAVAALAESMRLCDAMGLDQQHFVELLDGGPLGSAYAIQKLDEMRRHEYPAGFPVRLALKDLELVHEVQESARITMPVLDAVLARFLTAGDDLADQDVAAIYELDVAPAQS